MKKLDIRSIVLCALFVAVCAVCAALYIPSPVPFSLQIFGVFLSAFLLGCRRGTLAVTCYILLGAVGVPVFAGFRGGLSVIMSATGGFILSFPLVSFFTAYVSKKSTSKYNRLVGGCAGLILCYTVGTIWFIAITLSQGGVVNILSVMAVCVLPYIIPDILKLLLADLLTKRLKPLVENL